MLEYNYTIEKQEKRNFESFVIYLFLKKATNTDVLMAINYMVLQ